MENLNRHIFNALILFLVICGTSCKKFLEVGSPKTEIGTAQVFNSDVVATDAVLSIYGDMMSSSASVLVKTTSLLGQAADELQTAQFSPQSNYYTNGLLPTSDNDDFWTAGYKDIYYANTAIACSVFELWPETCQGREENRIPVYIVRLP